MAISNELSSEIAAAILAEKKTPQELNQLKEVILRVHTALQKMSEDARTQRFKTATLLAGALDAAVKGQLSPRLRARAAAILTRSPWWDGSAN